jgi:broad specificity phosphatase PhoE/predicted nucleotidyltransferase component of viral defense system
MELSQVKNRIKQLAKEKGVTVQSLWDMFFFENLLKRITMSKYSKSFIFKGGFLLQSIVGIETRSTMDLDFKFINENKKRQAIFEIFKKICETDTYDSVSYHVLDISDIKAEFSGYKGRSIRIQGQFYNVQRIFSVDIALGDVVTPYPVLFHYASKVSSDCFDIFSYPVESIIAEKFETIISKGTNNSRIKDFIDIFLLHDCVNDLSLLNSAIVNTFYARSTLYEQRHIHNTLNEVFSFDRFRELFDNYKGKHGFASNITWEGCKQAVLFIAEKLAYLPPIELSKYGITIDLVRHGEDQQDRVGGWSDNHLTLKGMNEVEKLLGSLSSAYDLFISSDLNRAKETADIISKKVTTSCCFNPDFRETNNGELANISRKVFNEKYPALHYSSLKMDERYPGGESPKEFFLRVSTAFMKMIDENRNKKILLVTHGGVINVIFCLLNGFPYTNQIKIAPSTGTLIKLT